jgi:hypothetical protein
LRSSNKQSHNYFKLNFPKLSKISPNIKTRAALNESLLNDNKNFPQLDFDNILILAQNLENFKNSLVDLKSPLIDQFNQKQ